MESAAVSGCSTMQPAPCTCMELPVVGTAHVGSHCSFLPCLLWHQALRGLHMCKVLAAAQSRAPSLHNRLYVGSADGGSCPWWCGELVCGTKSFDVCMYGTSEEACLGWKLTGVVCN